ncbi:MAG: hypothetical protein U5L45_22015 [Saprospiraceae bacterium]|nr:hypothetical protein [Saprospiraceae bacterium]
MPFARTTTGKEVVRFSAKPKNELPPFSPRERIERISLESYSRSGNF